MNKLLIIFIVFVVSAASFEGFFAKWTFRDVDKPIYSFESMYEGTAERPFVYRQLLFTVSKCLVVNLPENIKTGIKTHLQDNNFIAERFTKVDIKDEYIIEYYIIYFACFASLFVSTLIWRRLCAEVTKSLTAGTLAALTFTILFPYLETNGGYCYDCPELLFFSLATLFAYHGNYTALILLTPIAAHNKESFLFFILTLYPLLRAKLSPATTLKTVGASVLIAGLVYLWTAAHYSGNGGGRVYFYLVENLLGLLPVFFALIVFAIYKKLKNNLIILAAVALFIGVKIYLSSLPMFSSFEGQFLLNVYNTLGHTYSVVSGEYAFFLHLIFIFYLVKCTWSKLNREWRLQAKFAFFINLLLIVPFGLACELRNWSILYPIFVVMISVYIKNFIRK